MYQVIISINNNEDVIVLPAVPPDLGPQIPQNNGTYEGLSGDYNTLDGRGVCRLNSPCSVDSFSWSVKRNGDIAYSLTLREYRFISGVK